MNEMTPPSASNVSEPSLAYYLSVRDQPCPKCGVNLRRHREATCPNCGHTLSVRALQASRGVKTQVPVLIVRVLSFIAFLVAGYLAVSSLTNSQPAGCSPGAGCGEVLSSPWSSLWGMPVSVPGVVVYFSLFLLTFHLSPSRPDQYRRIAWSLFVALAVAAGIAALWFIYLQLFQIKSICPYCMVDHTCGLLIAALVLYSAPLGRGEILQDGRRSSFVLSAGVGASVIAAASLAVGMVIAAQFIFPAPTHRMLVTPGGDTPNQLDGKNVVIADPAKDSTFKAPPVGDGTAKDGEAIVDAAKDGAVKDGAAKDNVIKDGGKAAVDPPPGVVVGDEKLLPGTENQVFVRLPRAPEGGLVRFMRTELPMRGNINAKVVLVCMVDYTCPHCRALHHLFDKAWQRYGDNIAFMMVPMPLNPDCNPYMDPRDPDPRHAAACDLARLSLAVWKADASKFAEFDEWLFESPTARTGEEARAKAEELIGKAPLKEVFDTGWPHEQALKHVRIYEMAGLGRIPKILYNNVRIEGGIQESDLWKWLESAEGPGLTPIKK